MKLYNSAVFRNTLFFAIYSGIFLSGAAGLIYQVAWQKYLSRLLGSDSIATAIILAAFLGGLSLGYFLCGKLSGKITNHFKAYAIVEGIICLWCLFFPMIFEWVYSATQSWSFSLPFWMLTEGFFCSILLMGIPTICMGSTIPFLTQALSRNIGESSHVHARIYAINTAGACIGTLAAGFFLIPEFGLPLTMMGTSVLNFGVFIFFYLYSSLPDIVRNELPKADGPATETVQRGDAGRRFYPASALFFIAFLSGFYVMTLENVLIRICNFSLGSSSYTFSLVISVFILSIAIGSYFITLFKSIPRSSLFFNQLFITLSVLLLFMSLDTWPYWAHLIRITFQSNEMGFLGYYISAFVVLTITLIVPIGLMGATVPLTFHEIRRELRKVGNDSGLLFSWNTIGNVCGSIIGGSLLFYYLDNPGVFLTAVFFAAISTLMAGYSLGGNYRIASFALILAVCGVALNYSFFYNDNHFKIGTFRNRSQLPISFEGPDGFFKKFHPNLAKIFGEDGPTTSVTVIQRHTSLERKPRAIVVNGKSDSDVFRDMYTLKLLSHIPALLSSSREKVMVIGLGTGVTAAEFILYDDSKEIDVAEISPAVVNALPLFGDFTNNVHESDKLKIHQGDAFRILQRSQKRWDIIVSEPSNPWVTGVDLLFTREFYELAKSRMTERGLFTQWFHTYSADLNVIGMIVNTLKSVFSECRIFLSTTGDLIVLATDWKITQADIARAEMIWPSNEGVIASLDEINIKTVDSILLREIWSSSITLGRLNEAGYQTLDNPRLHYIAGKAFFIGEKVPMYLFLDSDTAFHEKDYLLSRKYPNWRNFEFTKNHFESLQLSAFDVVRQIEYPIADYLRIKAYLSNPETFPLSDSDKNRLGIAIIPFIGAYPEDNAAWRKIGLENAGYREKAETLLNYVKESRNWIVPYPIDGLKELLAKGSAEAVNGTDRNWCALQLAIILKKENSDTSVVQRILMGMEMDESGKPKLDEAGKGLYEYFMAR